MTRRSARPSRVIRLLAAASGAASAFALAIAIARPWSMFFWSDAAYGGLLAGLALSFVAAAFVYVREQRAPARANAAQVARYLVVAAVALAVPWFVWIQPFKALWLTMYAGAVAGFVALGLRGLQSVPRRLELVAFNLCLALLLAEAALRVLAAVSTSPVFAVGASPSEVFARFRKAPGERHLGFACDERGFCDRLVRAPGTKLVAGIGDSFGFGLVPQALHYTTRAEQDLDGIEIYNASVIAAGPAEYLHLLVEDVLPLRPDAILCAFFVGNDVEESERFGARWPLLARVLDREQLMLGVLPKRLWAIAQSREGDARPGAIQGEDAEPGTPMPWLEDPALEAPTMSASAFLEVELRRARFVCAGDDDAAWSRCFAALDALIAAASGVPIAFVVIPDEFQVEDALWASVAASGYERDRPQRILGEGLRARGIAMLDLLPAFLAVPPLPDGQRHLYHRRDTHWNRRGNEVAGRELARFLSGWLAR